MTVKTLEWYLSLVLKVHGTYYKNRFGQQMRHNLSALRNRINRQIAYRIGYDDRMAGKGAQTTNGSYLDGYYSEHGELYYVTRTELRGL